MQRNNAWSKKPKIVVDSNNTITSEKECDGGNTTNTSFSFHKNSFAEMSNFFHREGYIRIEDALLPDMIEALRRDLHAVERKPSTRVLDRDRHKVHKCFFEQSAAMVELIRNSHLADFAEYVIRDIGVSDGRPNNTSLDSHVIHNNAFIVPPGGRGQAPGWHVDDPCQQVVLLDPGAELPDYVRLPTLCATYMIWLTDCLTPENGPTFVVPRSHRWGRAVDADEAERLAIPMCGKAGTAILLNPNTWHRGAANQSQQARETVQVTFARRIIGHKHKTIMNYMMPRHVYEHADDKLRRRLGFLQGGAYS